MAKQLRWGIAGTGIISQDLATAIQTLPVENQIVAVGARSIESAQTFAKQFNVKKAYGSYKELAQDGDLDVVYVATVNAMHYDTTKTMLRAGKNVLCEKPMTIIARQARELLQLAKDKNVFLMEGFWSKCFPVYERLRAELASGGLGDIGHVGVRFGFPLDGVGNMTNRAVGGGGLLALGSYAVMFINLVYGDKRPQRINATATLKEGVDVNCSGTFYYSDGGVAQFTLSMLYKMEQTATIYGSKGIIKVPNFWSPTQIITPNETYEVPLPKSPFKMNNLNSEGFVYEVQHVRECILKGLKESPLMTHASTLMNSEIIDAVRQQIGVSYEADNV